MTKHVVIPEDSETGQLISAHNRLRQYDFIEEAFSAIKDGHDIDYLSHDFLYNLNFHAVNYLSCLPGRYRSLIQGEVTINRHTPPRWDEVDGHMDRFLERMSRMMKEASPMEACAYAAWRICWVHPFMQGNGRTARAYAYFILCVKFEHWFSGKTIPERIRATRDEFCDVLSRADATEDGNGDARLDPVMDYLNRLFGEQLAEANP